MNSVGINAEWVAIGITLLNDVFGVGIINIGSKKIMWSHPAVTQKEVNAVTLLKQDLSRWGWKWFTYEDNPTEGYFFIGTET